MTLWQRWKKVSINNKLMIYMTAILAIATTLYTLMYRSSVRFAEENARQTTTQTERLIAASEKEAASIREALEETKRANREAAERAERAINATEKQANASLTQANTSQVVARAAERSADAAAKTFAVGERPFITTKEIRMLALKPNTQPKGEIILTNSGRSSAFNVTTTVTTVVLEGALPESLQYPNPASRLPLAAGQSVNLPMEFGSLRFVNQEAIDAVEKGNRYFLYVYGIITYQDGIGKQYTTKYCAFYKRGPNDTGNVISLYVCTQHNDAN